jgi:putative endonuclease
VKRKDLGFCGEAEVGSFLIKQGFNIVARNYYTRYGEIDIIAEKGEVLAFIEVKTRSKKFFSILQVITYSKRQRIINTAKHFLLKNSIVDKLCRFDVATVIFKKNKYEVEYLENAFQAN